MAARSILCIVAVALFSPAHGSGAAADEPLRIIFHGYIDRQPHTATAQIDGARLDVVTDLSWLRAGGEISPDGTLVAYDSCLKMDRGINVARLDGSDVQRIVDVEGSGCVDVRWSRDGKRLSYTNPTDRHLHVIDLDARVDAQLPSTSEALSWHAWSPAGDAIVYDVGKGGQRRLDIIDLATGGTRQLVGREQFGGCEVWGPDWSPLGDRIAFTACDRRLYVVNADGTGLTLLARSAYAPRWTPDGTWVLFLSGSALLRVSSQGGAAQLVGVLPYSGGPFSIGPRQ